MTIEFVIGSNGAIRSLYKDERLPFFERLGKLSVKRASNVEWENIEGGGWTVRAAHDPELAIRIQKLPGLLKRVVARTGDILVFVTREAALGAEQSHFWELLPTEES